MKRSRGASTKRSTQAGAISSFTSRACARSEVRM